MKSKNVAGLDPSPNDAKRPLVRKSYVLVVLIGLALPILVVFWSQIAEALSNAERLRAWILSFGAFAPLALIVVQATQIVVAPIPGYFAAAASGYLFGPWAGTLYGVIGTLLGATLAFLIARRFGTPVVRRLIPEKHLSSWERFARMDSLSTWVIIMALPVGDVVYYIAGLTSLPLRKLLCATTISRTLGVFLASLVGAQITTIPEHAGLIVTVVLLIVGAIGLLFKDYLQSMIERHVLRRL